MGKWIDQHTYMNDKRTVKCSYRKMARGWWRLEVYWWDGERMWHFDQHGHAKNERGIRFLCRSMCYWRWYYKSGFPA